MIKIERVVMRLFLLGGLFSAVALSSPIVNNPTFAVPSIPCALDYAYQGSGDCNTTNGMSLPFPQQNFNGTSGFDWTLGQFGDGLVGNIGASFQHPSFGGLPFTQAVFLQGAGSSVTQAITGFTAGQTYVLSFYLGSRQATGNDGSQTVEELVNGSVIGTWALTSFTPFTLETAAFTASTGSETLEFEGLATGDHTAFLSDAAISTAPEPSSLMMVITGAALLGGLLFRSRRLVPRSQGANGRKM